MSNRNNNRFDRIDEEYKREIKQVFLDSGESITHITDVSPENMINGKIAKSINRPNNYETERGDWVFASSSPMDGNNPYIARNPKTGMIIIAKKAYIYGGDNMQVKKDEQGNKCVVLKIPNYVYQISPQNFMPVVIMKIDESEKPYFEFSEEWISEQDVDINDKNQVRGIRKISDITNVVKNYQVFCDVNMTGEARKIRSSSNMSSAIKLLKESIKSGRLRYINAESGINVSPKLDSSEVITDIQENRENIENDERD